MAVRSHRKRLGAMRRGVEGVELYELFTCASAVLLPAGFAFATASVLAARRFEVARAKADLAGLARFEPLEETVRIARPRAGGRRSPGEVRVRPGAEAKSAEPSETPGKADAVRQEAGTVDVEGTVIEAPTEAVG